MHACIGRMGGTKICILISIKRVWQRKAGREQFTPCQSELTPTISNCFVLYLNAYNGQHKTFIQFTYVHNCVRENYLIKLFEQCRYE